MLRKLDRKIGIQFQFILPFQIFYKIMINIAPLLFPGLSVISPIDCERIARINKSRHCDQSKYEHHAELGSSLQIRAKSGDQKKKFQIFAKKIRSSNIVDCGVETIPRAREVWKPWWDNLHHTSNFSMYVKRFHLHIVNLVTILNYNSQGSTFI